MYAAPFLTFGGFFHSAIVDDFFVGIGDINSSFLPKIEPLTTAAPVIPPKFAAPNGIANSPKTPKAGVDTSPVLPLEEDETNVAEIQATKLLSQSNAILDAQLEERPLAKKQEELQEHDVEEQKQKAQVSPPVTPPVKDLSTAQKPPKKALLKNDDYELIRIGNVSMETVATLSGIRSLIDVL